MIESKGAHTVLAIMANTYIPEDFRRDLGNNKLNNVYQISVSQQDKDGQPWGYVTMEMHERVPYMVRRDGSQILIDFNVAGLAGKSAGSKKVAAASQKAASPSTAANAGTPREAAPNNEPMVGSTRLISIDFQEANIKSVFRLLAEEGGVSIASGDDVKGNVTLTLKKVTWQEAFETVCNVYGLGRVKEGDVFIVKTMERMRKEEKTMSDEAEDRVKRQKLQEMAEQEKRVKDGKLPQISIEAKIVEVSRLGARELGILWGGRYKNGDYGIVAGNYPYKQGRTDTAAYGVEVDGGKIGASYNVPSATSAQNPTIGVIVAASNLLLVAKLDALETAGEGKIVSAPRVTTLDNEPAKIGQGEEIPYVTRDKDGTPTVMMKDAKLELKVKPKITSEGKISMEITAENKYADWEKVNKNSENPPLVASNVESKVVVKDGDTIVLGGIMKTATTQNTTGVPWLSKIPVFGWLFKTENKTKDERELLIFVTPRIIKQSNG
jgi:type IV pilus assembly protein PilQ